ncbi:metallophosphoesterase family protein [Desulfospira joergensenii]|uniref:metallophosphoesterase family protein n=1 Tax=Desulfospira joergensenii TaxID=53329 RepID=UPI0003B75542|nr:metallophosphoesterase family protein [Desulfospira joergensenii]
MKIAVITDIHGNYEAFSSVLRDIRANGADVIVSLGDNIGYGADSERVIQRVKDQKISTVLGNHEMAVLEEKAKARFRKEAQKALESAMNSLSEDSLEFIRSLGLNLSLENCLFVHGFPPDSNRFYLHLVEDKKLLQAFCMMEESLCFVGHTHQLCLVYIEQGRVVRKILKPGRKRLERGRKYMVNAGSVGQPRDGSGRATYVLWNTERYELEVRSLAYDAAGAARKIRAAGIPEIYARILTKNSDPGAAGPV